MGPLFHDDDIVAEKVLRGLISAVPRKQHSLDVPEPNPEGVALACNLGLFGTFRSARICTKRPSVGSLHKVFGKTSFVLGRPYPFAISDLTFERCRLRPGGPGRIPEPAGR